MSLDKIKEAVLKASRTEAERINAAAARQAKEKLDIQKENLRREFEYQYEGRSRLIEEEYARKLAHFQGTAGKEYLEARNASLRAIFDKALGDELPPLTFLDLDWNIVNKQLERERQKRRSGPVAENILRDVGSSHVAQHS